VPADAIVIADGAYLLGPELRGLWDFQIFVAIHFGLVLARGDNRGVADPVLRRLVVDRANVQHPIPLMELRPRAARCNLPVEAALPAPQALARP
jgi:hypothetical protein